MYKKHSSVSFIALLFMSHMSEHKQSGAFEMLKTGVRVSDITRDYNCNQSTIQLLRDCYKATGTVKDRRRSGQPRMVTDVKMVSYVNYIGDVYIKSIPSGWLLSVPDE